MRGDVTRRALTALAALFVTATAMVARADPTARLDYARAPGAEACADEAMLRSEVAQRLGYDPFGPTAKQTVVARIGPLSPGRPGFVAHVAVLDEEGKPQGTRELRTHGSCGELVDTVALAIAIAIGPRRIVRASPSAPAPTPAASGPAVPTSAALVLLPEDSDASDETPAATPLAFEASLGGLASVGTAPAPSVGLDLGAARRWPSVSLGVEARVDAPASTAAEGGGRVSVWRIVGSLVPCWEAGPLFVCAVAQVGRIEATGEGPLGTRTSAPWWAAGVRFGATVPLTARVALRLSDEIVADLDPPRLVLNGESAWRAPALAASLGVDVVVRFP